MDATANPPRSIIRANRRALLCPISRKLGYRTRKKALRAAGRSEVFSAQKITVYKCRCGRFHLTHQAQRGEAA